MIALWCSGNTSVFGAEFPGSSPGEATNFIQSSFKGAFVVLVIIMKEIYIAPEKFIENGKFSIFLAGTIDSGNSEDWQTQIIKNLPENLDINIFNPRRSEWPSDSDHNEVEKQIMWELELLERADLIIFNILPQSKSPISLMEIGLFARFSYKVAIFCKEDFYRYDNIKCVANKYNLLLNNTNNVENICNFITHDMIEM